VDSSRKIIGTYVGNGSPISAGDGGPAALAVFGNITSVAADSNNNLFITDGLANRIRYIDLASSTIRTVVGTGVGGFSGDGGLATAAKISSPTTVAFNREYTAMYFTDTLNQRVRRVDVATSTIYTVAGTGVAEYNGDNISSVRAALNFPQALSVGYDGSVYVGDTSSFRIRKLAPNGFITTFAGCGIDGTPAAGQTLVSTSFGVIHGLAAASTTVIATDATTSALWSFNSATNTVANLSAVSTPAYLGDAGPLSNAYFSYPTGVVYDSSKNLVICDSGNFRLRKTYTFGNPRNPLFLSMNMKYTNYFTTYGTGYIKLNGNILTTFDASLQVDQVYEVSDLPVFNYPLQSSNPISGDQTPFLEITQTGTTGYVKLAGNFWMDQVRGQGTAKSLINSNAGIIMNTGSLIFPNQLDDVTIDNHYNDASMRTINYMGSLNNASDPALKEGIEYADLEQCYMTLKSIPLRTYSYIPPYISTFQVRDKHRLGFLTSEVAPYFPKSVTRVATDAWVSSIDTLDMGQIKYAHLGVTQHLLKTIEAMEAEVSTLRSGVAQRKSVS
jgi:sugar lactone lactonase YvrE